MADILKELANIAEKGPIAISIVAFGVFLLLIKWTLPIIKESTASNTRLATSIDRLSDTNGAIATALTVVEKKVDDIRDSMFEITDRVTEHEERIVKVENKIQ